MDFNFTDEDQRFRDDLRALIKQELGGRTYAGYDVDPEMDETALRWLRVLGQRGWIVPSWPKALGGAELSIMQQFIFRQEEGYHGTPRPPGIGAGIAGPAIALFGTEEQKARFLPGIARAETVWCQGFSEHGAGSDLASLQCRAVRDGDHYVVNGTKMWTSYSHFADRCLLLVRTDPEAPKHRGITALMVDLETPGITLHPYLTMMGVHHFNEVVYDDVRIPVTDRLGDENRGWYVATAALDHERSGIGMFAAYLHVFEEIVAQFRLEAPSMSRSHRSAIKARLADRRIEIAVGNGLSYRIAWMQSQGIVANHEASMAKVFGSELGNRLYGTGMNMLGLSGQLQPGSPLVKLGGRVERGFQWDVVMNIAAGSSEIQRNIIATRGLGLPRG